MFSKDELIAYFADRYTEEQIIKAVKILAEKREDINPDGNEFSEAIIEELESIFNAIGAAVDQQKKLAGNDPGGKIEIREVGAIAQESLIAQDILIPEEVLMVIAQTMVHGVLEQVNILSDISEQVLLNSLQARQRQIAENLANKIVEGVKQTQETFSESNVQKIVNAVAPEVNPFDVDTFINQFKEGEKQRKQQQQKRQTLQKEQVNAKQRLNIDAFLEVMGMGKEE